MRNLPAAAIGFCLLALPAIASASTLVVDRGLPISNLNNAAGGNRSNVAWADDPVPWFYGDNFQLAGGSGSIYSIDTIRTWAVSTAPNVTALQSVFNTGVTLFTGTGTTLSATPASLTITPTAYAGAQNYQSFGGETRFIYQLDFTGLSIVATGGTTISFGVEGTGTDAPSWYNHASNAALSGAIPQDSADDLMAEYSWTGTIGDAPVYFGVFDSNANNPDGIGWDKGSDINVQVFATVPEPATLAVLGLSLAGLGVARRRRK